MSKEAKEVKQPTAEEIKNLKADKSKTVNQVIHK